MDSWVYFLVAAAICAVLEKTLGLAFIFYGFALLFLTIGLADAVGFNILESSTLVELLIMFIFTPIVIRLYFVIRSQQITGSNQGPDTFGGAESRNAIPAYKGILIAGRTFSLLVYHFVTGGWAIAAFATILGYLKPDGELVKLASIAFPYAAGYIAFNRGASGIGVILWGGLGLFLGVILSAVITFAVIVTVPQITTPVSPTPSITDIPE